MVGIDYDERGTIADEYIKAIKAIWTQPSASFDGRYVKFRDAEIFPKPMQKPHPPIWIAGDTRRAMRRVAELGDGWHPTYASPQTLAEGIAAIENLMDRYHHRKRLDYGTVDYCCVSKLSDDAGEIARRTLTALGGGKVHPEYFQTLEKSKQRNLIGSVQEVSRLVDAYERAGATYLGLKFIYRSIEEAVEMMELFSREIISSH
jgi:alkanesulfonate monooxygenase SsuD/methylene tetrahydromethanopterin reductase-like flavin-dependent oxidoreductase (luciferase family)